MERVSHDIQNLETALLELDHRNRMAGAGGQSSSSAALLLGKQFKQMQKDVDIPGISCGLVGSSVFEWEVMLMLSDEQDSLYGGESV